MILPFGSRRLCGTSIVLFAAQISQSQRVRRIFLCGQEFLEPAGNDDLAAMNAGAGADVDDIVGGKHRIFVMLDDDDGVAEVAQIEQAF